MCVCVFMSRSVVAEADVLKKFRNVKRLSAHANYSWEKTSQQESERQLCKLDKYTLVLTTNKSSPLSFCDEFRSVQPRMLLGSASQEGPF